MPKNNENQIEIWQTKILEILFGETFKIIITAIGVLLISTLSLFLYGMGFSLIIKSLVISEIISICGLGLSLFYYMREQKVRKYLKREVRIVLNHLSSGSNRLKFEEILGEKKIFIPLNLEIDGDKSHNVYSMDILLGMVEKKEKILLLGDAGQGKTIALTWLYKKLVDRFIENKSDRIPLLIPLLEMRLLERESFEEEDLFNFLKGRSRLENPFPFTLSRFHTLLVKEKIILLLDSFEEIPGDLNQDSIISRSNHFIFHSSSVLSCRNSFYNQYLSGTEIKASFLTKIKVREIDFSTEPVKKYTQLFCKNKMCQHSHEIIKMISDNETMLDLSKNPLQLMMILDIFTDGSQEILIASKTVDWDIAQLYRLFADNWLQKESGKIGSYLDWHLKDSLLEEIAWKSYYSEQPSKSLFGRHKHKLTRITDDIIIEVVEMQKNRFPGKNLNDVKNDITHRSLLVINNEGHYFFTHNNFRYYYIAKFAFECFKKDSDKTREILEISTPMETATFLRKMLKCKNLAQSEKEAIVSNLIFAYESSMGNMESQEIIREHSSYYLTCIGTKSAIDYVENVIANETSGFVKRGIFIGLATNCDKQEKLDEYIDILFSSPQEAEINLSYEMAYYGDKPLIKIHEKNENSDINHTLSALITHLRSEKQKNHWALDLFTLTWIIKKGGGKIIFENNEFLSYLQIFLKKSYPELGPKFVNLQKQMNNCLADSKCNGFEMIIEKPVEKSEVLLN